MLNLKEIAKATGGTLVTAGKEYGVGKFSPKQEALLKAAGFTIDTNHKHEWNAYYEIEPVTVTISLSTIKDTNGGIDIAIDFSGRSVYNSGKQLKLTAELLATLKKQCKNLKDAYSAFEMYD